MAEGLGHRDPGTCRVWDGMRVLVLAAGLVEDELWGVVLACLEDGPEAGLDRLLELRSAVVKLEETIRELWEL